MDISPDGATVRLKTINDDALFYAEKTGLKPNTVRIIDRSDREKLRTQLPQKILIQGEDEIFLRTLTHVYVSEMILGKYLVIFSWTNIHPAFPGETDFDTEAHTMNRDTTEPPIDEKFVCVTIRRNLHHLLESIAHGRSMNMVIQELYETSQFAHYKEVGPLHD